MNVRLNEITIAMMALAIFAAPASADMIKNYYLTVDGCSGSCGTGPFATITLDQVNSTTVLVTETLNTSEHYVFTGAGDSLEFNLLPSVTGTTTLTNISSGFHQDVGTPTASAFGTFGFGVECYDVKPTCHGGQGTLTSLSFDVVNSNGISISDFTTNTPGYYFASDIYGTTGNTGDVGGNGTLTNSILPSAPEPATLALLGLGLCGIGLAKRRVFRK